MKKNHQDLWFLDNVYINYMSEDKLVFFNLVESYQNYQNFKAVGSQCWLYKFYLKALLNIFLNLIQELFHGI